MSDATRMDEFLRVLTARKIGSQPERSGLAAHLVRGKRPFDESTVSRLRAYFAAAGKEDPDWHITQAIRSGEWVQIDLDELEKAREQDTEQADRKRGDSGMAHVTAQNPYGWANRDFMQSLDHDIPGEWNAYRQCYNLTRSERDALGARDHKLRGCSRAEVMGGSKADIGWRPGQGKGPTMDAKTPKVDYDPLAVSKAQGRDYGTPETKSAPKDDRLGRVYGE